jgi:hypothetical protein
LISGREKGQIRFTFFATIWFNVFQHVQIRAIVFLTTICVLSANHAGYQKVTERFLSISLDGNEAKENIIETPVVVDTCV